MAIKTEMLRCFVTVARSGNLADAAEKLGRTPSAVSMMLKQLEDHLGEPLFESERKSKLTALGTFTLNQAVSGLEHFQHATSAIESYARAKSGFVRIAVVPSVAETILPEIVQEFLQQYPDVHVDIRDMDSAAVLREIERGRVDLGIATGTDANAELACEELFSDSFGIVCRDDHPLAKLEQPLSWSDLVSWPIIANGLCARISDTDFQQVIKQSKLMVHSTTSLLALVRVGVGVTVLPRLVVGNGDGEFCFLTVTDPLARRRIDLLRRTQTRLSPAAQKLEEMIRTIASSTAGQSS